MAKFIYRGPSDAFMIGDKVLERDGKPVELSGGEEKVLDRYTKKGHRFVNIDEAEMNRAAKETKTKGKGDK